MPRAVLLAFTARAAADYDNFPVKSVSLSSAGVPSFYNINSGPVEDAHPVYGFEASDGGFVYCGKGLDSEVSSNAEAFVVKFSSTGA